MSEPFVVELRNKYSGEETSVTVLAIDKEQARVMAQRGAKELKGKRYGWEAVSVERWNQNPTKINAAEWKYVDARGVKHRGHVQHVSDRGGSDVTYFFIDKDTGELSLVSGPRMKLAHATGESSEPHPEYFKYFERRSQKKENPMRAARLPGYIVSENVTRLEYQHKEDGDFYYHDFEGGVTMKALPDGSIIIYHPRKTLWKDIL